jgi:hypothetical protein
MSAPARLFSTRVEYHSKDLDSPGMCRVISRSSDSVCLEITRQGVPAGDFRFALGPESRLLERAVELALATGTPKMARNVGRLSVPSGATIEVGAYAGCVLVRFVLPDGTPRRATRLFDSELEALRRALHDLHTDVKGNEEC